MERRADAELTRMPTVPTTRRNRGRCHVAHPRAVFAARLLEHAATVRGADHGLKLPAHVVMLWGEWLRSQWEGMARRERNAIRRLFADYHEFADSEEERQDAEDAVRFLER